MLGFWFFSFFLASFKFFFFFFEDSWSVKVIFFYFCSLVCYCLFRIFHWLEKNVDLIKCDRLGKEFYFYSLWSRGRVHFFRWFTSLCGFFPFFHLACLWICRVVQFLKFCHCYYYFYYFYVDRYSLLVCDMEIEMSRSWLCRSTTFCWRSD